MGVGNEHFFFLLLGGILLPSTGFAPNGRLGGRGRAVHTRWGNKQDERRGNIFGKMEAYRGHGFNSNELFQISRDYETENVHHRQNFW